MEIYHVDIETIEKLASIVSKHELSEISVAYGESNITIKGKKTQVIAQNVVGGQPVPVQTVPTETPAVKSESAEKTPSGNIIKSPIVGTFYSSPAPDKPAFVKVGDTVKKGDVVMIIESMKLMNEVTTQFDGVVREILVENGQAVEYDQPVMIIE